MIDYPSKKRCFSFKKRARAGYTSNNCISRYFSSPHLVLGSLPLFILEHNWTSLLPVSPPGAQPHPACSRTPDSMGVVASLWCLGCDKWPIMAWGTRQMPPAQWWWHLWLNPPKWHLWLNWSPSASLRAGFRAEGVDTRYKFRHAWYHICKLFYTGPPHERCLCFWWEHCNQGTEGRRHPCFLGCHPPAVTDTSQPSIH